MDSWTDAQIKMMKEGGNSKLREWFSEHGEPNNMRISAKYQTPDAVYYGKRLKAVCEGKESPAMPPRMPVDTSVDYSRGKWSTDRHKQTNKQTNKKTTTQATKQPPE